MKVTITKIDRKEIETKRGKAIKVGIQTKEHGNKWLGAFENSFTKGLKEGAPAYIVVTESGKYLNFEAEDLTPHIMERLDQILAKLGIEIQEEPDPDSTDLPF